MRLIAVAMALSVAALAGDLDDLRATQQKLIAARDDSKLPRDEVPLQAVAAAKKQLLAWVESRLSSFERSANPKDFAKILNQELESALAKTPHDPDGDQDSLGEFEVELSRPDGAPDWLQLITDIGIPCGHDESAYLYERSGNQWRRRFAEETNDYRRRSYEPQESITLKVSAPNENRSPLVLSIGVSPACISVWQTLYTRLYRIGKLQTLLFDKTPDVNIGEDISTTLDRDRFQIEFSGFSIEPGFPRKYVWHYAVKGDNVQRIEPMAASVQTFVQEWLTGSWKEVGPYSDPKTEAAHQRLHKDHVSGDFVSVQSCKQPGQTQIDISFEAFDAYFRVSETGDKRFKMLDVTAIGNRDCSGPNKLGAAPN